jgi:CHRD domain-containing protein
MKLVLRAGMFLVVLAVLGLGSYAIAGGGKKHVDAELLGYEEVPSNSTTGAGNFDARINEGDQLITYKLSYSNLEGTTTIQAHIHLGQRTANGGVSVFLCGGGDKPACPATGGTVEGTIDPADIIGPTGQGLATGEFAELVAAIRAGVTYANVHTNKHPGGEIRGQINDENERDD